MPKKTWTPEERAAFAEKMKAARAKKTAPATEAVTETIEQETIVQNDDTNLLLKRIEELESRLNLPPQQATPQAYSPTRVITKFSLNPKDYPDPRVRLAAEAKLARFAFPLNYELSWNIERVNYEDGGVKYVAPRFVLELLGKVLDEETNEPKQVYDPAAKAFKEQRYIIRRGIFLEDPESYIYVANQNGYDVPDEVQQDFIDEMRYLTMRDWLFGWFFPQLPDNKKANKQEQVIGNRVVEIYEVSSETGSKIPFDQLTQKL